MIGLDKKWLAAHRIDADSIAALIPFSGHAICHFAYRQAMGMSEYAAPYRRRPAPLFHVRPDAPPLIVSYRATANWKCSDATKRTPACGA